MDFNINDIVAKYIELRDSRDVESKAFQEAMAVKYNQPMETIEKVLLREMERMGVDSVKTPSGTPYKAVTKSVKMSDASAYKQYIFKPLIDVLTHLILSTGGEVPDLQALLTSGPKWDMVDFRPLKKGVVEHTEETGQLPPGVTMDTHTTINIRRS